MKKFFYSVLAAATMLFATTSCSSEEEIVGGGTTGNGNTQKVTFSVQLPDQTESRAIANGVNVGKGNQVDKLIWALYEKGKENNRLDYGLGELSEKEGETGNQRQTFTASIDMVKGLTYKVLFFAYDADGCVFQLNTTPEETDLKALKLKNTNELFSNKEGYDAFVKCHEHIANDEAVTTVTLTRPFAQINAATSIADLDKAKKLGAVVTKSELVIKNVPTQYDIMNGVASEVKDIITYQAADILTNYQATSGTHPNEDIEVEGTNYKYLTMAYVLAGETNNESTHNATFNFYRGKEGNDLVRTIEIPSLPIQRNFRTNVIGDLLTQTESFKIVIDEEFDGNHNILEGDLVSVATVKDIQNAIDKADGPTIIKFTQNIDKNSTAIESKTESNAASIIIKQKEGVDLVIDGCGFKFDGTFYLEGQARNNGTETLTFKNINFEHTVGALDFISCNETTESQRYAHNVTVENCTFTGNQNGAVVGMRYRQCYNMTVKNTTGTNLHSLMWTTGGNNITLDNVTITDCSEGAASFGTSKNITIENSTITLNGNNVLYGISVDGDNNKEGAGPLVIKNSTINAKIPVFIRRMSAEYKVALEGDNTLTTSENYHIVFTNGNWSDILTAPTGTYSITGADNYNVYPREIFVSTIDELNNALNIGKSVNIKLANKIEGVATVTEKQNVDIVIDGCGYEYDGQIKIKGNSEYPEECTLLIKNINFKTSTKDQVFIWSYDSKNGSYWRYAENVTVDNCTFTADGEAINTAAGVTFNQAYNIKITNCTATNMHSLAQFQSIDNDVIVDNVTINECKNGISFGNTAKPTISNSTINATAYGIRGDGDGRNCELVVKDTKITAKKPVIIRRVNNEDYNYSIDFEGNNVLDAAEEGYQVVFTNGEDDETYVEPTGKYTITGAESFKMFPVRVLHEESGLIYNGVTTNHKSVFYIYNEDDLKKSVKYFSSGHSNEANVVTLELEADIDLKNTEWTPWSAMWITFNGNNHIISNIKVSDGLQSGFFGYIGGVKVNDLTFKNVNVVGAQAGILAGAVEGVTTTNIKIEGNNSVTYKEYTTSEYTETHGGIGAVTGVLVGSTINAEITEGTDINIYYNNIKTEAIYKNIYTGYIESNKGTITDNGTAIPNGVITYNNVAYNFTENGTKAIFSAVGENAKIVRGFDNNGKVTSVIVEEGIVTIGNRAFRDMPNCETIILPNTVTTFEEGAFQACGIKALTVPESVTYMGKQSIGYLPNLETIIINAKNVTIANYLARACPKLKSVYIYSETINFEDGSMYFTNKEDADASGITFYVNTKDIAAILYNAMKVSHSYGMKIVSIDGNTEFYNTLK